MTDADAPASPPAGGSPAGGPDAPASPLGRGALVVSIALVVASLAIAVVVLARVGVDATVPIHWGADGKPNGYGPAWLSLLLTPVIQVGLLLLLAAIPRFEPRRLNLSRSGRSYSIIVVGVMALMTLVQAAIAIATLGGQLDLTQLVIGGCGVLFIAIGLAMPGFQPNYIAGVRTPWTLTSDVSWRKTHVLAGRLFVVVGAGMLVATPFFATATLVVGMLTALVLLLVAVTAYSYRVWRTDPDRRTT
jgi:uncharacterized membrane protein